MINFTNNKVEKKFKKLSSNIKEMILKKLKEGIAILKTPNKRLRTKNSEYRIKCKKFRIFYKIEGLKVWIYEIGQKDKNAYKGI